MLTLDCRNGVLVDFNESRDTILQHLDALIAFENTQFFSLRTIDQLLKNYPSLYLLSTDGQKLSELAKSAVSHVSLVSTSENENERLIHLLLVKKTKVIHSELKQTGTVFTENGVELEYSDTPSLEINRDTSLTGMTPEEEVSLSFLNIKDLYHLPIKVCNAEVHDIKRVANADRTGLDYKNEECEVFVDDHPDISLKELLDGIYSSLDIVDPEDNEDIVGLIKSRIESLDRGESNESDEDQ